MRVVLGFVGGLIVGFLFAPEELTATSSASPSEDEASPLALGDVVAHLLDFLADQVANRHYAEQGATLVHDR